MHIKQAQKTVRDHLEKIAYTKIEKEIIKWFIKHYPNKKVVEQLKESTIRKREYTVVGFFTYLNVPSYIPKLTSKESPKGPINGPMIESSQMPEGGFSLLYIENGNIDCLELVTHGKVFPKNLEEFKLIKI